MSFARKVTYSPSFDVNRSTSKAASSDARKTFHVFLHCRNYAPACATDFTCKAKVMSIFKKIIFFFGIHDGTKSRLYRRIFQIRRVAYRFHNRQTPKASFGLKESGRKGQMFIIGAILIVIGLIMLKNLLGIYSTAEEKRYQESVILDKQLRNVKNEYKYIVATAAVQADANASGIAYLSNFSNFIRNDFDSKIVYMFVYANGTTQRFSVTVGNFINDKINVTVNATNSNPSGYLYGNMNDMTNLTRVFNATINGTINVTLTYTYRSANFTERMPVIVSTRNLAAGLFDITLEDSSLHVRSKETYNWTYG